MADIDDANYGVDSEGRTRFVRHTFVRDPNGPVLQKNKGPVGHRTPNGFIWAHSLSEFVYIPRVPSVPNYVTTWSRSMLKVLGENYDQVEKMWSFPLVPPRVVRPWPVLKLPLDHNAQPEIPIGAIDEGCDFEHSGFMLYTMREDVSPKENTKKKPPLVPRRCSTDSTKPCSGRLKLNEGADAVPPVQGWTYDYVWCEHFRALLQEEEGDNITKRLTNAVNEMSALHCVADNVGVRIVDRPRLGPALYGSKAKAEHCLINGSFSQTSAAKEERSNSSRLLQNSQENSEKDDQQSDAAQDASATAQDLFTTHGLPKLEEFIPDAFFPDVLLVHDPENLTKHRQRRDTNEPLKYRRVVNPPSRHSNTSKTSRSTPESGTLGTCIDAMPPERTTPESEERVAHLHLRKSNQLGSGNHSYVYRAPLTLPAPLSAHSCTLQVTVAAKLAQPRSTAHALLHNEARAYAALPRHAQETWCGYNIVPPCRFPVPVGPIAPKCYGFYLPVGADGRVVDAYAEAEAGGADDECEEDEACEVNWASPILLLEECGEPVEPAKFTIDQRTECFSLVLRLHELNVTQGSFWVRNILIQPGPLSLPPAERTLARPSFRIIDFGRAKVFKDVLDAVDAEHALKAEVRRETETETETEEMETREARAKEEREVDAKEMMSARKAAIAELHKEMWEEENQAREQLLINLAAF